MIITDPRYAAALVDDANAMQKFDDIGCMRLYRVNTESMPRNFWVHDYANESWMEGKDAIFVQSDNLITPMGYGVNAFSERSRAQQFAQQEGRIVSWKEMVQVLQKKGGNTSEISP